MIAHKLHFQITFFTIPYYPSTKFIAKFYPRFQGINDARWKFTAIRSLTTVGTFVVKRHKLIMFVIEPEWSLR